jgi:antitoxin component YwqK of YwqJK toxin-antitoxin module
VLNNYGLPYSTVIQSFDTDGYLLYKKEQHLRGGWSRELRYSYNERGWMQEVTSTEKNKISESRLYSYDELGNILWMETIAGERKNKLETIYSKDGLLEAVLKTSSENSDIHIVKFKYEFW